MLKIALAQIEVVPGHPDINVKKMLKFIDEAKTQEADVIIFPFFSISGSMLDGTFERSAFLKDSQSYNDEIIKASENITIFFTNDDDNVILVAKNGKLIPEQDDFDGFKIRIKGKRYKIACTFEDCNNGADFFDDKDKDFFIVFSAKPFVLEERKYLYKYFKMQAKNLDCPIIRVNCVGVQNKGKTIYVFDGGSFIYNSKGEIVHHAAQFEDSLTFFDLSEVNVKPEIEEPEKTETELIYKAIYHGVKSFLGQIGMKKIVIGISGGIDSAVDAALYTKVLGPENVLLVNMPSKFNSSTTKNLSEQLAKNLGCNYMVVPIQESVDWTVKQIESTPMTFLSNGTSKKIELSSFVRENIQARDRSARILATLAAAFGGGFTCNANKAETTVGYATMYGDSAGVLSALADLWKYQVYDLARYINEFVYEREVIPQGIIDIVPSAELSTAQNVDEGKGDPLKYPYHDYLLKSFVEGVKDKDDFFDYNVTPEEILKWYSEGKLEEKIGCESGLVKKYFATDEEFINDLERWWNQFTGIAVAKRIQSPPLIAVTYNAFGADFPESQNGTYYTRAYKKLKAEILKQEQN